MPNQIDVRGILDRENVVQIVGDELVNIADGFVITGILTKTWTEFADLAPSDYVNYHILISNVYGSTLGDGGLLVRGATSGWIQTDNYLVCAFATLPTAATKYKGWRAILTDLNNVEVLCSGTAWVKGSASSQLIASAVFGTNTTPTAVTVLGNATAMKIPGSVDITIPAGLLSVGSKLRLDDVWRRTGGGAALNCIAYLGTDAATGSNNSIVHNTSLPGTSNPNDLVQSSRITITGAGTSFTTTGNAIRGGNGMGGSALADRSTLVAIGSAMTLSFWSGARNAADVVALQEYDLWWEK